MRHAGLPVTEEGLALYYERQMQQVFGYPRDDSGLICSMLALGLASGVVTPAQTFSSVYTFIERLVYLYRHLLRPWNAVENDQRRAHAYALYRSLRTFRRAIAPHFLTAAATGIGLRS